MEGWVCSFLCFWHFVQGWRQRHDTFQIRECWVILILFSLLFVWPYHAAHGILIPQPGTEPMSPAVEAQSLHHRTAREFPSQSFIFWAFANMDAILYFIVAKSLQLCLTLCNPIAGSPPGSPVPGILQARTLGVAISFSNAWKWKVKVKSLSRAQLLATPWTGAHQAPPSMGFSRQEYWSGVPLPSPIIFHYLCLFSTNF